MTTPIRGCVSLRLRMPPPGSQAETSFRTAGQLLHKGGHIDEAEELLDTQRTRTIRPPAHWT